jgi:hypothetical protein
VHSKSFAWHTHSDTLFDLKHGLRLAQNNGVKSLMMLTCNLNAYPEQVLNSLLKNCPLAVFGGSCPMITRQETLMKRKRSFWS